MCTKRGARPEFWILVLYRLLSRAWSCSFAAGIFLVYAFPYGDYRLAIVVSPTLLSPILFSGDKGQH